MYVSISLTHLVLELLGHREGVCLASRKLPQYSKNIISFYITINCVWAFQLFPASSIFSLSADCIVVSHCAFNVAFTSVIINDVDHFFMSLSEIYISCFVKCWSKSCACFSIRLFVFLLLSCKFFLYPRYQFFVRWMFYKIFWSVAFLFSYWYLMMKRSF